MKRIVRDAAITLLTTAVIFVLVLLLQQMMNVSRLIPMLFVLGVFLVALNTKGYFWGIAASLLGVLAVNYAFMFPYYAIDLLTPLNLTTAVVMLAVSIMTSTMTTQIGIQQEIRANAERERMRANLLRAVSHDLRTPLTGIYGACSVMLDNDDSIPKEQKMALLEGMRRDADWLIRMVENLLTVTRIDEKRLMVQKTPTVLEELVDSVLVRFRKHYPSQTVEVRIPDAFISIPMDAMLIEQVLINLLENAVVHAKGMTKLQLTVEAKNDKAVFCVADDGCGIPREKQDGLFTAVHGDTNDSGRKGMGIGLFVCASIIRAHGSEISVYSPKEGGAAFRFALDTEEYDEQ